VRALANEVWKLLILFADEWRDGRRDRGGRRRQTRLLVGIRLELSERVARVRLVVVILLQYRRVRACAARLQVSAQF
jgi:hypothetical protein